MAAFIDDLTEHVLSLRLKGRKPFNEPLFWMVMSNGGAEYHDSVILFGFECGRAIPSLVAKTPRLPEYGWALQLEYDRLVELWKYLGPQAELRLPEPIDMLSLRQQPVLIISYVQGESLLRISRKALWEQPQKVMTLAVDAARSLRAILDQTAVPLSEGEQVPSDFAQKVAKFRQMFSLTDDENQMLENLISRYEINQALASHKVLIQGDFWHGNMIRAAQHGQLMFVDWQFSRWATDVSLDVYFFLLAGALANASGENSGVRAKAAIRILSTWGADIIPAYLAAFGKLEKYCLLPVFEGMLVCCVEKAVRASLDYGYNQADDEIWRQIFAEMIISNTEDRPEDHAQR